MTSWRPTRRAEQAYERDLLSMLLEFFREASTTAEEWVNTRLIGGDEFLQKYSWQAAQRMVMGRLQDNTRTWRQGAKAAMRGDMLHGLLQQELSGQVGIRVRQLVASNSDLIRTLPHRVAGIFAQQLATRQQVGERSDPQELLRHVSRVEARRIARTETSKASTALTRARSEDLGAAWYVWRTSEDARVRWAHRKMAGVICRWMEPPAPERLVGEHSTAGSYNAGDIWNCRCYPEPLLRLEQIGWPHRVFLGGRVTVLRLTDFRRLANLPEPLAA